MRTVKRTISSGFLSYLEHKYDEVYEDFTYDEATNIIATCSICKESGVRPKHHVCKQANLKTVKNLSKLLERKAAAEMNTGSCSLPLKR